MLPDAVPDLDPDAERHHGLQGAGQERRGHLSRPARRCPGCSRRSMAPFPGHIGLSDAARSLRDAPRRPRPADELGPAGRRRYPEHPGLRHLPAAKAALPRRTRASSCSPTGGCAAPAAGTPEQPRRSPAMPRSSTRRDGRRPAPAAAQCRRRALLPPPADGPAGQGRADLPRRRPGRPARPGPARGRRAGSRDLKLRLRASSCWRRPSAPTSWSWPSGRPGRRDDAVDGGLPALRHGRVSLRLRRAADACRWRTSASSPASRAAEHSASPRAIRCALHAAVEPPDSRACATQPLQGPARRSGQRSRRRYPAARTR